MKKIINYVMELRAPFLTVTVIPVIAGAAIACRHGAHFDATNFALVLFAFIFFHLGTNVFNDYFDHVNGTDNVNTKFIPPFTGGSRLIQNGVLSARSVFIEGALLFTAGTMLFVPLIIKFGSSAAIVLAFSLIAGIFYTAPPFKWAHLGLGELMIFISFGPLMVLTSFFMQGGRDLAAPLLISVAIGLLAAAIVDINQFPDYDADMMTGKNNLIVRLGPKNGKITYIAMVIGAFVAILAAVVARYAPASALLSLLAVPVAVKAVIELNRNYDKPDKLAPACGMTILTHLLVGIIIILAFII